MKRLGSWDRYVREASRKGDRSIELPLTDHETYVINYPTRRQGREISRAQQSGDTDAMLIALLGEKPGKRVMELAEDQPAYVLDEFLIDVMKKFGLLLDDEDEPEADEDDSPESAESDAEQKQANGGKPREPEPTKPSARLSIASS